MTKRELILQVAERLGYTQNEVSVVVTAMLESVIESLAEGQRLEIRNFGVFEVRTRDPRVGRNPKTGEEVVIGSKRVVSFRPGKALKEWVGAGDAASRDGDDAGGRSEDVPKAPSHGRDGPGGPKKPLL